MEAVPHGCDRNGLQPLFAQESLPIASYMAARRRGGVYKQWNLGRRCCVKKKKITRKEPAGLGGGQVTSQRCISTYVCTWMPGCLGVQLTNISEAKHRLRLIFSLVTVVGLERLPGGYEPQRTVIMLFSISAWQLVGATAALALISFYASQWVLSTLRPKHYPPGPPVIPGLGNLLDIPLERPYLKFQEWKTQYGDIVGLKTGAGNMVILNSPELVHEVFEKRGAQFSDRPEMPMFSHYVFHKPEETQVLKLQYDDFYRRWRKSLNHILGPAGIQRALPLLEAEACNLARKCLDGGKGFHKHMLYCK